jgi:apolipoprotein N-acyltransferase
MRLTETNAPNKKRGLVIQQVKDLCLVLSTVLLFFLSFPGGSLPWLAWFALIPVGIALHHKTRREAFTLMASTALLGWMTAAWWIIPGVAAAANSATLIALPFAIIFCLLYAIPYGIAGMLYSRMGWTHSISGATKSAFLWTAIYFLTPHVLPGNIAHSQYLNPRLIQIVEIGGIPLLFFMIHWFNWLLVAALLNLKRHPVYAGKATLLAILIPLLLLGYGEWRLDDIRLLSAMSEAQRIQVGWIQPNLNIIGRDRRTWEREAVRVKSMSRQLLSQNPNLDLLIWPEIPPPISYIQWKQDKFHIDQLLRNTHTALLLTGHHNQLISPSNPAKNGYYNVIEFIPPLKEPEVYQKQYLLPFSEYLPGEDSFPLLRQIFPNALRYIAGKQSRVFSLNDKIKLIPLICYEAVFSKLVRSGWQQGGNIIINPVNDGWFGKTAGAHVHLALAVFRTVEFRIPMVRATNTGPSALITASGEIDPNSTTPLNKQNIMAVKVTLPSIKSIYANYGDVFAWLSIIIAILSLLWDKNRNT